ncbi:MAG TPA: SWIM zinc finger family protein [Ktedonobacterales bacterium]|nr:SWIM zinc finger family protein [Ktedonobacterales bacterium]
MPKQTTPTPWGAQRWLSLVNTLGPDSQSAMRRARNIIRDNRIMRAQASVGSIEIQSPGSYWMNATTRVRMRPISDPVWERIIEGLTAEASVAASLFAGELPPQIERVFTEAGAKLFPESLADLKSSCDCREFDNPCRHVIALHLFFAAQLETNPFLVLLFRGRPEAEVTEALRERWATAAAGTPTASDEAADDGATAPLRQSRFFVAGPALDQFAVAPTEPQTPMALLRRLGRPQFATEREDPATALAPIYELTTMRALQALGLRAKSGPVAKRDEQP